MEQKTGKGQKTFTNAQLVWYFLDGSKLLFLACIAMTALSSLADMLDPQIIRATIDYAIAGKPSELPAWANALAERFGGFAYIGQHLWIMALALMAVALVRVSAEFAGTVLRTKAAETLVKTMRDRLFAHIGRLPYAWHSENHTGDIIQRCTSDVNAVRRFVAMDMASMFSLVIYLGLSLYFMLTMNVRLTLAAVAPLPFFITYAVLRRKTLEKGYRECDENEGLVSATVQEDLSGVRVVRAFAREAEERRRFEERNEHYTGLWVRMSGIMGRFFAMQDMMSGAQILIVMIVGARMAVAGSITPGDYVAFISYNALLQHPIRRLGRMISNLSKAGVSLGRLAYIMNSPEETDVPGAGEADMRGDIVFDGVRFSYAEGKEILSGVSFTVKAGTTVGILGGTGSGKSTLMLLLDRMYELPVGYGTISIGGVDIRNIRAEYLRRNIAMVLQEPYLFSRSIAENIGIAREGLSLEKIREASAAACLDESVEGFPKGYDTFVGERGVTLSGGQQQRAAIARALTLDAPIMVFDDSLSAVDTETDAKIRAALESRFGTATIIIISHRITTLSKADQVIVLDGGRVAECGTPDELSRAGGIYQKIHDIQYGRREAGDERA